MLVDLSTHNGLSETCPQGRQGISKTRPKKEASVLFQDLPLQAAGQECRVASINFLKLCLGWGWARPRIGKGCGGRVGRQEIFLLPPRAVRQECPVCRCQGRAEDQKPVHSLGAQLCLDIPTMPLLDAPVLLGAGEEGAATLSAIGEKESSRQDVEAGRCVGLSRLRTAQLGITYTPVQSGP